MGEKALIKISWVKVPLNHRFVGLQLFPQCVHMFHTLQPFFPFNSLKHYSATLNNGTIPDTFPQHTSFPTSKASHRSQHPCDPRTNQPSHCDRLHLYSKHEYTFHPTSHSPMLTCPCSVPSGNRVPHRIVPSAHRRHILRIQSAPQGDNQVFLRQLWLRLPRYRCYVQADPGVVPSGPAQYLCLTRCEV